MRRIISLLVAGLAFPTLAAAQTPPPALSIAADKPYRHQPSGLVIPTTLDGLKRFDARAFTADHLDEAFNFGTPDGREDITVFIFRHVTGSVPLWFDQTARIVARRNVYGGVTTVTPPVAFVPPGQSSASGMIASYRPGKGPYKSTALAYLPLGADWYVELRYSSTTVAAEAIDGRLRGAIAALGWPRRIEAQPAATPVVDCAAPLVLNGTANVVKGDDAFTSSLLAGLLGGASQNRARDKTPSAEPPRLWCHDTGTYAGMALHGVYRPTGSTDSYLIALNDAGRGIWVAPDTLAAIFAKSGEKPAPTWTIALDDVAAVTTYPARDRLPSPEQTLQIVAHDPYASKVNTWGKQRTVQINSSTMK